MSALVQKRSRLRPGSFAFIDAHLRAEGATGAAAVSLGAKFEQLCIHFLRNAPQYRGTFKRVWKWKDWPGNWGPDKGIDVVAETVEGKLWAIQAKAVDPSHFLRKDEIDSFLSESNRRKFAYRLLIATTDNVGTNAREVLQSQEKPVGVALRGDLVRAELAWPRSLEAKAKPLPAKKPLPHQRAAIADVVKGFRKQSRGQLIMACGTGKTLTALWTVEKLAAKRVLLLVPSLSLVQQTLAEWRRNATHPFRYLVVCSDETVDRGVDAAIHSTKDLGVPVTTDPTEIRRFLQGSSAQRSSYVFCTYQSSDRIADAQRRLGKEFDLVIADEAHRCAGARGSSFGTVLDSKRIEAKRRLFMTATPRYFTGRVKKHAAELDYEIASMDDEAIFGPVFHRLSFNRAIKASLLTDYQVVVIGVSDSEAKRWAEEGKLVRTRKGGHTDARTLAAQIGLAKATRKYDLRRVISFHSSIKRAAHFTDPDRPESYPGVVASMASRARPSGTLWTTHISGEMPAGRRRTLLNALEDLDNKTRGVISNCSCLGEGVDVPALDGVAFIDPKRSMVDIIQAVGRVIRRAPKKQIGTIVIPVFVDESESADKAILSSAFEPVWQVLRALRAHDQELADELDTIRTKLGRQVAPGRKIHLPDKISIDVPELIFKNFERAFHARAIERSTALPRLTIEQVLKLADRHYKTYGDWPTQKSGPVANEDGETWVAINNALHRGLRGLPSGKSLVQLLEEHRGRRNKGNLSPIREKDLLRLIDQHRAASGEWPTLQSRWLLGGQIERWKNIDDTLRQGGRGLPGGSSLAIFLQQRRGVRNLQALSRISESEIMRAAKAHYKRKGKWPHAKSGDVYDLPGENWRGIDNVLRLGYRGLVGGRSLGALLSERFGIRVRHHLRNLSIKEILKCADEHHQRTGKWPTVKSGAVKGLRGENWRGIHHALYRGARGIPAGGGLARLLAQEGRHENRLDPLPLSRKEILKSIDLFRRKNGRFPKQNSGQVEGYVNLTWSKVSRALKYGLRGLPGGSSLGKLIAPLKR